MPTKRSKEIVISYALTLGITVALLVGWVIYVLQSISKINELASRVGGPGETYHWFVLAIGCALFTLVIVGVTLQLAHALAERRYSRKQEEFLSNITHEMKSPLAAAKLHAQTLQEDDLSHDERRHSVSKVLQQIDRMGELVDNVLESSRLLARKKAVELEPVSLERFLPPYFEETRTSVEAQGVRLVAHFETRAVVMATSEVLRRVMTNLIDNAVRFSARGGEVRVNVHDLSQRVRIEVEDDGVGIPKTELRKIFDRFYQIGAEISDRRKGTGLGLSIVSGLVREMKGSVRAFSQEGRPGTRFVVELPMVEADT